MRVDAPSSLVPLTMHRETLELRELPRVLVPVGDDRHDLADIALRLGAADDRPEAAFEIAILHGPDGQHGAVLEVVEAGGHLRGPGRGAGGGTRRRWRGGRARGARAAGGKGRGERRDDDAEHQERCNTFEHVPLLSRGDYCCGGRGRRCGVHRTRRPSVRGAQAEGRGSTPAAVRARSASSAASSVARDGGQVEVGAEVAAVAAADDEDLVRRGQGAQALEVEAVHVAERGDEHDAGVGHRPGDLAEAADLGLAAEHVLVVAEVGRAEAVRVHAAVEDAALERRGDGVRVVAGLADEHDRLAAVAVAGGALLFGDVAAPKRRSPSPLDGRLGQRLEGDAAAGGVEAVRRSRSARSARACRRHRRPPAAWLLKTTSATSWRSTWAAPVTDCSSCASSTLSTDSSSTGTRAAPMRST